MKKSQKIVPHIARRSLCGALALLPLAARAQLRVEITGVGGQQFPIAIAPFAVEGSAGQDVAAIVRDDLARSGLFRIVDAGTQPIADSVTPNLAEWKSRGADALAIGSVRRLADGRFDVRFRLLDTVKQLQLDGLSYLVAAADLRLTAHRIADRIYEKLTGERGVFATRIAYVVQTGRNAWELHIADADGANSAGRAALARADHLAGVVAGRHAPCLRVVRDRQAGRLRPHGDDGRAQGRGELPRLEQRTRLVAGRPDRWR